MSSASALSVSGTLRIPGPLSAFGPLFLNGPAPCSMSSATRSGLRDALTLDGPLHRIGTLSGKGPLSSLGTLHHYGPLPRRPSPLAHPTLPRVGTLGFTGSSRGPLLNAHVHWHPQPTRPALDPRPPHAHRPALCSELSALRSRSPLVAPSGYPATLAYPGSLLRTGPLTSDGSLVYDGWVIPFPPSTAPYVVHRSNVKNSVHVHSSAHFHPGEMWG